MMTLKYLRSLDNEKLRKEYEYNRNWQLRWFDIYEDYYKVGKRDKDVSRHLEEYTKAIEKINKVLKERGVR